MKCKIIKLKHEFDSTIPKIEEFETIKEIKGHSLYNLIQNNVNKSDCWMLITSNDHGLQNNLYRIFSDHSYTSLGKLQPSVKNSSLTFDTLRKANIQRLPEFKNSKGLPAHSKSDGSDWSPAQWLQAVIGELGEYANVMKKVERGDLTFEEAKPLIEKELADVMTYLDILAFRVGVDLAKATEQKFNEVSERVGCSLRIENNEVVRKEIKAEEFKLPVTVTNKELREVAGKLGSGELTTFSINNRKSYVPETKKDLQEELAKIKENVKARIQSGRTKWGTSILDNYDYNPKNGELTPKLTKVVKETQENSNRMEKYKSSAKQIASNWIGTNKISNTTRAKIEDLIEKDILDIKKSIDSESGKVSDIELIVNAALMGVKFGDAAKLKVDQLIKNDLEEEEFNYETEIHKLVDKYEGCEFYPLEVSHDLITDLFGLQFQEINTLKQYVFAQAKTFNLPKSKFGYVKIKSVNQFYLFDFFSKQLGTKIVGMLINGHKENTKLNPGDLIQFYDDRNVLYNFRLVKSSDKNVEVSAT